MSGRGGAWVPRVLREDDAARYAGVSPASFRRHVVGEAPDQVRPVRLTPGTVGFLREDIDRWIDSRSGRRAIVPGDDWGSLADELASPALR